MFFKQKSAIESGLIKVNGKDTFESYIIKNGDVLTHKITRKELPVYKTQIQVIFENEDLLVINKPPSIPIHGCGGYYYNTIINIVEFELNCPNIHGQINSCTSIR